MRLECIETDFSSNCYVIYNNKDAYIIDPSCKVEVLKKYINDEYTVKGVLLTHAHIDHVCYLEEVVKNYECCAYMNKYSLELLKDAKKNCSIMFGLKREFNLCDKIIKKVNDNDVIDNVIKAIYTPGHTIDSMCYLIDNNLFTGDTLFNMSIGRTDLYSGDYMKLVKSIQKIYSNRKNYDIFPGHGENSNLNNELYCNFYVKKIIK